MSLEPRLDRLWALVPEIYRRRDRLRGYPLRALLRVLAEQANVIEDDIERLYDGWFIETAPDDLVPYLAELIGHRLPEDVGRPGTADGFEGRLRRRIVAPRREVARAVARRRRKGTAAILEEVAEDVTGWPAKAVEFRTRLVVAHNVRFPRSDRGTTVDLRAGRALERIGGPFDTLAHTVDVRSIAADEAPGRHGIGSVGVFVWRIPGLPVTRTPVHRHDRAGSLDDGCYSFNVLGIETPLFTRSTADLAAVIEGPADVPMPLTREELAADPSRYVGAGKSLQIFVDDRPVSCPIAAADLRDWGHPIALSPAGAHPRAILVDPELGRLVILGQGRSKHGSVRATWSYGLSAAIGGGEYERRVLDPRGATVYRVSSDADDLPTLSAALERWAHDDPDRAVIELWESDVYSGPVDVMLRQGQELVLRAGQGRRPVLRLLDERADLHDAFLVHAHEGARLTLDGLMIAGRSLRVQGKLRQLALRHCTLVPTRSDCAFDDEPRQAEASLQLDELAEDAEVTIERCILGPIVVEDRGEPLRIAICDSIVDAQDDRARAIWSGRGGSRVAAHAVLVVRQTTVFGEVHAHAIELAEDAIFSGCVHVERRQRGCMRFCWVCCSEATPRRFHCQPDLAIERAGAEGDELRTQRIIARVRPIWDSRRYGDFEYARLADHTDAAVRRGAHDESEMGVFHDLYTPQRMARLREMLREFVPADAEVGVIPVT